MFLYITILLIFLFAGIYINLFVIEKTCPPSNVVYRYLPEDTLKLQFTTKNNELIDDLFTKQYNRLI